MLQFKSFSYSILIIKFIVFREGTHECSFPGSPKKLYTMVKSTMDSHATFNYLRILPSSDDDMIAFDLGNFNGDGNPPLRCYDYGTFLPCGYYTTMFLLWWLLPLMCLSGSRWAFLPCHRLDHRGDPVIYIIGELLTCLDVIIFINPYPGCGNIHFGL